MSASLFWSPNGGGTYLPVDGPSSFIETLRDAGYELPCSFGASDISVLRGMRAASRKHNRDAYDALIEAIEKHESVTLEARY